MDNLFFKPTPLYKEFMILDMIEKDTKITQRKISDELGISVSMVNSYLESYENKGYIKRKYISAKIVEYNITNKGIERRKYLNIEFLKYSQHISLSSQKNMKSFLNNIIDKGFKNILLYGAGEVAEIILQVLQNDKSIPLNVIAVIDDDILKQNNKIVNVKIISLESINRFKFDGILISSFANHKTIFNKLLNVKFDNEKIIQFFE